jgi:hypothetical protein
VDFMNYFLLSFMNYVNIKRIKYFFIWLHISFILYGKINKKRYFNFLLKSSHRTPQEILSHVHTIISSHLHRRYIYIHRRRRQGNFVRLKKYSKNSFDF